MEEHCDVCRGVSSTVDNPIVLCGHRGCLDGRHRRCWADNDPPSLAAIARMQHRCYSHGTVRTASFRSARKRTVERAAAAAAERPRHNLPPAHPLINPAAAATSSSSLLPLQSYQRPLVWRATLDWNCQQLGVELRPSSLGLASGDGVNVIRKKMARGSLVGYFNGKFIPLDEWQALVNGGPDTTTAVFNSPPSTEPEEEFASDARKGQWRCLHPQQVGDSLFEYVCLISRQCPMGYINDPRRPDKVNVAVRFPDQCVQTKEGVLDWRMLPVYATKDIDVGAELFIDYGWTPQMWKDMQRCSAKAAAATVAAVAAAIPVRQVNLPSAAASDAASSPPKKKARMESAAPADFILPPLPTSTGGRVPTISATSALSPNSSLLMNHPIFSQLATLRQQHRAAYDALSAAANQHFQLTEHLQQERRVMARLNALPSERQPVDPFSDSDDSEESDASADSAEEVDEETLAACRVQRRELLAQHAALTQQRLTNSAVVLAIRETAFQLDCRYSRTVQQLERALVVPPAPRLVGIELNPGWFTSPAVIQGSPAAAQPSQLGYDAVHFDWNEARPSRLTQLHTVGLRSAVLLDLRRMQLHLPQLHTLVILELELTQRVAHTLSAIPRLTSLSINQGRHDLASLRALFRFPNGRQRLTTINGVLTGFERLRSFCLFRTNLTAAMVTALPPWLSSLRPMTITAAAVHRLVHFRCLRSIDFQPTGQAMDGSSWGSAANLLALLPRWSKLTELHLSDCEVDLAQVESLLRHNSRLKRLDCINVCFAQAAAIDRLHLAEQQRRDFTLQGIFCDAETVAANRAAAAAAAAAGPPLRLVGIELNPGPGHSAIAAAALPAVSAINSGYCSEDSEYSQPTRGRSIQRRNSDSSAAATVSPPASPSAANRALSNASAAPLTAPRSDPTPAAALATTRKRWRAPSSPVRSPAAAAAESQLPAATTSPSSGPASHGSSASPPVSIILHTARQFCTQLASLLGFRGEPSAPLGDSTPAAADASPPPTQLRPPKRKSSDQEAEDSSCKRCRRLNDVAAASSMELLAAGDSDFETRERGGAASPIYDSYPPVDSAAMASEVQRPRLPSSTAAAVNTSAVRTQQPAARPRAELIPSRAEVDWILKSDSSSDESVQASVNLRSTPLPSPPLMASSAATAAAAATPPRASCWPIFQLNSRPAARPALKRSHRRRRRRSARMDQSISGDDSDYEPPRTFISSTAPATATRPLFTRRHCRSTAAAAADSSSTPIVVPPAALLVGVELNPGPGGNDSTALPEDLELNFPAAEDTEAATVDSLQNECDSDSYGAGVRFSGPVRVNNTGWTRTYVYRTRCVGGPLEKHVVAPPYARIHICSMCTSHGVDSQSAPAVPFPGCPPLSVSTHAWCSSCREWSQLQPSELPTVEPLLTVLKRRQAEKQVRVNLMAACAAQSALHYHARQPSKWEARLLKSKRVDSAASESAGATTTPPAAPLVGVELNPGPGELTFSGQSFLLDYVSATGHDELRSLLLQLHAHVLVTMPTSTSEAEHAVYVYVPSSAPPMSAQLTTARSLRHRLAQNLRTHRSFQLPPMDACSTARCLGMMILTREEALLKAKEQINSPPRLIIRDLSGLYHPEVILFPMVPMLCRPQPAAPTAAAASSSDRLLFERDSAGKVKLAHTLPQLNWDAQPHESAFLVGGRPMNERAAGSVKPSKLKPEWCEWCRVDIMDQQMVRSHTH